MADTAVLELTRIYAADREKVFAAWTDPAKLAQWFRPSPDASVEIEADIRVGGKYRFHITTPDGTLHVSYGEYEVIEPPERLSFTWSWESGMVVGTLVTISLRAVDGGTELTLRHERLETEDLRQRHAMGWGGCLQLLEGYLAP